MTALATAMLPGAAGCFFMDRINDEPEADIQVLTTGPYYRGSEVVVSASKSRDPDEDLVQVSWSARTCNAERTICDPVPILERTGVSPDEQFVFTIPARRANNEITAAIAIEATLRDSYGAEERDSEFIDVYNRAPAAALQVQGLSVAGGYLVDMPVILVATSEDPDGDQVTYSWDYFPAQGSVPERVGWQALAPDTYRLRADVPGLWEIQLEATDSLGVTTVVSRSVLIQEDGPPCIAATDPPAVPDARYIVERDVQPRRFAVLSVFDDLDAYPPQALPLPDDMGAIPGSAEFRWLLATPETDHVFHEVPSYKVPAYLIDGSAHAPGDVVRLRVEVADRKDRDIPCDPDDATCSIGGSECWQRVTWSIEIR